MRLRAAAEVDLDFIEALEARPDFAAFILRWPRARHLANLADPDKRYLVGEADEGPEGYAILAGLAGGNRAVELVRVALARPGQGLGRPLMRAVVAEAFERLGAHRLWLDVFDDNVRARRLYCAVGFREEGILRDCLLQDGRFRSLVVMSLLEPEYRESR